MLGEIVCALNAETMQHFVSSLKVSVLQAQMMYVFERKNGGGGGVKERGSVCVFICPLSWCVVRGTSSPAHLMLEVLLQLP